MSKKAIICLIIPSLGVGGMQRVMAEIATFLSQMPDLEIHLIIYAIKKDLFYPIPDNIIIHASNIKYRKNLRILFTLKTLFYIRKQIQAIRPNEILSFGEYWNSFVLISVIGLKVPVYISDRCQPNKDFGTIHTILRKILYPRATGIIAQTEIAKDIYKRQFNHSNICVIGNPIRTIQSNRINISKENYVLSVGRFIPTKHLDLLVDIFLNINLPNWKLIILGDDVLNFGIKKILQDKIKKNHAENRVELIGNIVNVEEYYLKSKIFTFTSSSEGFPNVVGEAMSAGLPVISFDCVAGPSEMVKDGITGYLVPLFNNKDFEHKLKSLMTNEIQRIEMGENAIREIEKFSTESIGNQYYNFINNHKD